MIIYVSLTSKCVELNFYSRRKQAKTEKHIPSMELVIYQPVDWALFSKNRVLSYDFLHGALAYLWSWGGYE